MEKEIMIKAIYKKMADKTLSFGCKINYYGDEFIITQVRFDKHLHINQFENGKCINSGIIDKNSKDYKIIGHPVMIGDVLDYLIKRSGGVCMNDFNKITDVLWLLRRKPIEEQSEETINYIFDLINSN